jgi:hypothetical protein
MNKCDRGDAEFAETDAERRLNSLLCVFLCALCASAVAFKVKSDKREFVNFRTYFLAGAHIES